MSLFHWVKCTNIYIFYANSSFLFTHLHSELVSQLLSLYNVWNAVDPRDVSNVMAYYLIKHLKVPFATVTISFYCTYSVLFNI